MAIVLCSPTLWRFVRAWRSAANAACSGAAACTFGPWAATAISIASREIVLAVESHTYMTLVCGLGAEATFPHAWKESLKTAFEDMDVPIARVPHDACSPPRLESLNDERLTPMLAAVEFVCKTELHYCSNLRVVQRRLNEFPHDHPPDYAARVAVRRRFGLRA